MTSDKLTATDAARELNASDLYDAIYRAMIHEGVPAEDIEPIDVLFFMEPHERAAWRVAR
jgi:hypothetical protein